MSEQASASDRMYRLEVRHLKGVMLLNGQIAPLDAAEGDARARLSTEGRVVWRHPVAYGSSLDALGPAECLGAAWLAAHSTIARCP